jgi:transcriptional regulator with XRE-family HTH domain
MPQIQDQTSANISAIGTKIFDLRKDKGWTQVELATKTGFPKLFIISLENGHGNITLLRLVKLAQVFDLSVAQVVDISDIVSIE